MVDVTVIIVSWNARSHLRNCLDSVHKSGGSMIREVIVVDNASTDGSPEMVEENFSQVTLIRSKENLGFARANNLGMKCASAAYFGLINSDVIVHPGCFESLVAFLDGHREVGLVGPKIFGSDGQLQRTCRRLPTLWNTFCRSLALDNLFCRWPLFSGREMRHWDQTSLAEVDVLNGCFWLARREAVDNVGGLDERFFFYAEDVDWCKRFRDAGWKVVFVPQATATHFGGGSSSNAPLKYSVEMLRANLAYWKKHRGILGMIAFYLLSVLHHFFRLILRGFRTIFDNDSENQIAHKFKRSAVCLRWLIGGKAI
jgi:GT2 family glycosyltransferase